MDSVAGFGAGCRQAKLMYANHIPSPWLTVAATRGRSNRLLCDRPKIRSQLRRHTAHPKRCFRRGERRCSGAFARRSYMSVHSTGFSRRVITVDRLPPAVSGAWPATTRLRLRQRRQQRPLRWQEPDRKFHSGLNHWCRWSSQHQRQGRLQRQ